MIKFGTLRTGCDVQHIGDSQVCRKSQDIRTRGTGSHGQQQIFRAEGMATEHADFTGGANRDEMYLGLRKPVFRDTFLSSKFQNFRPWKMQKLYPKTCL
jgi:hypothetical protein